MKPILKFLIPALAGGIAGYFIAPLFPDLFDKMIPNLPEWYTILVYIFFSFFLVVGIHELGHILAGLFHRFQFRFVTVGPLKVELVNGKLQFKVNTELNTMGGLTLMFPSKSFTRSQMIQYYAGGPLFSLIFGGGILFWFILSDVVIGEGLLFWMIASVMSLVIGFVSLIPVSNGDLHTDGSQMLDFLQGGNRGIRKLYLLKLSAASTNGLRPSEWDAHTMEASLKINQDKNDQFAAFTYLYGFYNMLDSGNKEYAVEILEKAWQKTEKLSPLIKSAVALEMAFKEAYKENNAERSRTLQSSMESGFIEKSSLLRLEAACLMSEENWEKAESTVVEALSYVDKSMDKGIARLEKDWLNIMFDKIHSNFREKTVF